MKKLILPALFMGAIAFGSTSCKKDYTCSCPITGGTSYEYIMTESKKAAAYAACEGKGIGTVTTTDGTTIDNDSGCTIK